MVVHKDWLAAVMPANQVPANQINFNMILWSNPGLRAISVAIGSSFIGIQTNVDEIYQYGTTTN